MPWPLVFSEKKCTQTCWWSFPQASLPVERYDHIIFVGGTYGSTVCGWGKGVDYKNFW